jgi:membrane-bound inhibitor of C-type lysozyme
MQKGFSLLAALPLILAPIMAKSDEISLSLALDDQASLVHETYQCADKKQLSVRYVNSKDNRLALFEIDDAQLIFVNVISGSGARYVSGPYEWWVKGSEATLSNAMDESAAANCKIVESE